MIYIMLVVIIIVIGSSFKKFNSKSFGCIEVCLNINKRQINLSKVKYLIHYPPPHQLLIINTTSKKGQIMGVITPLFYFSPNFQ